MNATTSNAETMSRIRELMAAVCAAKAAGRDDLAAELQAELDAAREARAAEYAARFPHWVLA